MNTSLPKIGKRGLGPFAMAGLTVLVTSACATTPAPVAQSQPSPESMAIRTLTEQSLSQSGDATPRSSIDRANLEPLEETAPWPLPTAEDGADYYFVEARLLGDTVKMGGWGLDPAVRGRLLTADVSRDGLQERVVTGRAGLSVALPLETAAWLAILDLFRNRAQETHGVVMKRGMGKYKQVLQSQSKDLDTGGSAQTIAVTREISAFMVAPDIECSAQVKIFGEQVVGASAAQRAKDFAEASDKEVVPEWKLRQEMGLEARGRGQVITRLVSRLHDGKPRYELQIHMSIEVDSDGGTSDLRERALQCHSPRPIFARALEGYWIEAREQDGYWAVSVQASKSGGGHE
jgi:hypothetical protein